MIKTIYHTGAKIYRNKNSWQARNLAGWWPFLASQGTSTLRGLDLNAYNIPFPGGANNPSWLVDPEFGSVLSFSQLSDTYLSGSGDPGQLDGLSNYTIAAWVYPISNVYAGIMNKGPLGSAHGAWNIHRQSDLKINLKIAASNLRTTGDVPLNAWTHVVYVGNGTNTLVYLNGVLDATLTYSALGSDTNPFHIGVYFNTTTYCWNGRLSDIRIYNTALNANQVWDLYNPATRWDLYEISRRIYGKAPVAAAGSEGPLVSGRLIRGGQLVRGGVLVR